MSLPRVAVVMPCYNSADTVARALDCALSQTPAVGEIIAVNDGSSDETHRVLERFADKIEIISVTNGGSGRARNTGLERVTSDYVMFLDADDELEGPILSNSVKVAEATGSDLIFSPMEIRVAAETVEFKRPIGPPERSAKDIFEAWFDGGWMNPSCIVWRSSFVRKIGCWNPDLRIGNDGDIVLRALMAGARIGTNQEGNGIYNRGIPGSLSSSGGVTGEKILGLIELIQITCDAARKIGWGDRLERSYDAIYFLGRRAYQNDYTDIGDHAMKLRKDAGYSGHVGTRAHSIASHLMGLKTKVRVFGS